MPKKQIQHPWDTWFQEKHFTLVQGKHFDCMLHSMMVQLRSAAKKRKLLISVYIDADRNRLAVEQRDPPPRTKR